MLSSEPAQTMAIRKIQHRNKDCVGSFLPWDSEINCPVKSLADRAYSTSLKGWYIPCIINHLEPLPDFFSIDMIEYPFFLTGQTNTGIITAATIKDVHTLREQKNQDHPDVQPMTNRSSSSIQSLLDKFNLPNASLKSEEMI